MRADLIAHVEALLAEGNGQRPPVHLWHPPLSGDIDIRIARDGNWYHEGTRFERAALVRLFASILRREGDEYFLVTPVEKWRLRVECTPLVAIDCEVLGGGEDQQLVFSTNTGERVHVDGQHPLRMLAMPAGSEPVPCVAVRDGLEARVERSVFYRLVDLGIGAGEAEAALFGVYSGGLFHSLGDCSAP